MGVSDIQLFFKRYFGNFDFDVRYCGIIQPCGIRFSSFWLTVFGKRRSFTVLRYHLFSLSCLMQVNTMCSKYRGRGLSALTSPLFPRSLTLVPRSFLLNRIETLATQANKS